MIPESIKAIVKEMTHVCGGLGLSCQHAHLHGMLLATKLILKNLWIEWHK